MVCVCTYCIYVPCVYTYYVCMYVCMYCIYVLCVYTYLCMYVYMYVCTVCIYVHMTSTYVYILSMYVLYYCIIPFPTVYISEVQLGMDSTKEQCQKCLQLLDGAIINS